MAIETGVHELHAGAPVADVLEPDVDAARLANVCVELELAVEVPGHRHVPGWVPSKDHPPLALGPVDAELVPAATDTRLEHGRSHLDTPDVVVARPPRVEACGEYLERPLDRRTHVDREPDTRLGIDGRRAGVRRLLLAHHDDASEMVRARSR